MSSSRWDIGMAPMVACIAFTIGANDVTADAIPLHGSLWSGDGPFGAAAEQQAPASRGALFDNEEQPAKQDENKFSGLKGFVQEEIAHTIAAPGHWSKILTRAELGARGSINEQVKWKL